MFYYQRLIADVSKCKDLECIKKVSANIADAYGFENWLIESVYFSSWFQPDVVIASNFPKAFYRAYKKEDFKTADPVLNHCSHHSDPIIWSDLSNVVYKHPQVARLRALCRKHKLNNGISVATHNRDFSSMFCLVTSREDQEHEERMRYILPYIQSLSVRLHEAVYSISFDHQKYLPLKRLSYDEQQLLLCSMDHDHMEDCEQVLNMKPAVINKLRQTILDKLEVGKITAASCKAFKAGLLPRFR